MLAHGSSVFNFLRDLIVLHSKLHHFTFPMATQESQFFHILTSICYCDLFGNNHFDRCEVVTCGFDLHFPDLMLNIFFTCSLVYSLIHSFVSVFKNVSIPLVQFDVF